MKGFCSLKLFSTKARYRTLVRLLCFFVLTIGFYGCTSMKKGPPPFPWIEAYQTLNHPESMTFITNALERAVLEFGEPVVPVKKVLLRRSRKTEVASSYLIKEDFTNTSCIDPTNGVFVIFMGNDPDHEDYYGLLGHECTHLINPQITDWYMEGIATVFSEEFCAAEGRSWGEWKRHFRKSRKDPYAVSYRMMKKLKATFPEEYSQLVNCSVQNPKNAQWLWTDINIWLDRLSAAQREEAVNIIQPHVKLLSHRVNEQYGFIVPSEL